MALLALVTALLVSNCGSAGDLPTSPTPATTRDATHQSIVGAWRGSVRARAVKAGSDSVVGFALNCSQRWDISSQSDGHFEGQMSSQGSGPESDWRCTESRPFGGEMTSDGQVAIEFFPSFIPGGCTTVVGGERATGAMSDGSIMVALPYRATCDMSLGGAPSDLEITATITLTPW